MDRLYLACNRSFTEAHLDTSARRVDPNGRKRRRVEATGAAVEEIVLDDPAPAVITYSLDED